MKRSFSKLVLWFLLLSGQILMAQEVRVISFEELQGIMENRDSEVKVINFWATWCKPCIEELPAFQTIEEEYRLKNVKVYLISLDFIKDKERLDTFVNKKGPIPEVLLLNEPDYDQWIGKIDQGWSGAIPATLIISNKMNKKTFYERSFGLDELRNEVRVLLNEQ